MSQFGSHGKRPVLHGIDGSPFVVSARLALVEKGVDYDFVAMPMGSHKQPDYLAINPFGRVPVLEHDGFMLYETQAILRYVDRAFDGPALQPTQVKSLARMDQILNIVDWYFFREITATISFNRIVKPLLLNLPPDEEAIAAALPAARRCLAELEQLLAGQAYMAGDAVSLADLHLAPDMGYLLRTPEGQELIKPHGELAAWWARMAARNSVSGAMNKAA